MTPVFHCFTPVWLYISEWHQYFTVLYLCDYIFQNGTSISLFHTFVVRYYGISPVFPHFTPVWLYIPVWYQYFPVCVVYSSMTPVSPHFIPMWLCIPEWHQYLPVLHLSSYIFQNGTSISLPHLGLVFRLDQLDRDPAWHTLVSPQQQTWRREFFSLVLKWQKKLQRHAEKLLLQCVGADKVGNILRFNTITTYSVGMLVFVVL